MPRTTEAPSTIAAFQAAAARMLLKIFEPASACSEWRTQLGSHLYSPRLDLAVGPFATGELRLAATYDEMSRAHRAFLEGLYIAHLRNLRELSEELSEATFDDALRVNPNARCFLGVEIENQISRKHLMGGALNASALSRIAVLVGWTPDKVKALVKLRSYFEMLARVGKPTFPAGNLLILGPNQFWAALRQTYRSTA